MHKIKDKIYKIINIQCPVTQPFIIKIIVNFRSIPSPHAVHTPHSLRVNRDPQKLSL